MKSLTGLLILVLLISSAVTQTHWARYSDGPVLEPNEEGWELTAIVADVVMFHEDTLRMWYHDWPNDGIGYAWSLDGIEWTKFQGNPVILEGPAIWDRHYVAAGDVLFDDGEFVMVYNGWYNGTDRWQIGIATAPNPWGPWTKSTANPVITSTEFGDTPVDVLHSFGLKKEGDLFHLWFHVRPEYGQPAPIHCSSSSSLTEWIHDSLEVITYCGPSDVFDGEVARGECVIDSGNTQYLMYKRYGDNIGDHGLMLLFAGESFFHSPWNPINRGHSDKNWCEDNWVNPYAIYDPGNQVFRLYYTSYVHGNTNNVGIGYATSIPGYRGSELINAESYYVPGGAGSSINVTYDGGIEDMGFNAQVEMAQGVVMTTTALHDDGFHGDGESGDGVFGGEFEVPDLEGFYTLVIEDVWEHADVSLPYVALHFTTAGPLSVQSLDHLHPPSGAIPPGVAVYFNLSLENQGTSLAIENARVEITPTDEHSTLTPGYSSATFPVIQAGSVEISDSYLSLTISDECPVGTPINFKVSIEVDNQPIWEEDGILLGYVGVKEGHASTPEQFELGQNYPNPFNPVSKIEYSIPHNCDVTLVLYNSRGLHITELVNQNQAPGRYAQFWDGKNAEGNNVAAGVYFARLTAGEYSEVIKMVYLK